MLDAPFAVCEEGAVLGSGQTTLLKMFGVQMAEFAVEVRAWWVKETGVVEVVGGKGDVDGGSSSRIVRDGMDELELEGADGDGALGGFEDEE